jgi:hypothetical protein
MWSDVLAPQAKKLATENTEITETSRMAVRAFRVFGVFRGSLGGRYAAEGQG